MAIDFRYGLLAFRGRGLSLLLRCATCGVLSLTLIPQESSNPPLQSHSLVSASHFSYKVKALNANEKSNVKIALQLSKCI